MRPMGRTGTSPSRTTALRRSAAVPRRTSPSTESASTWPRERPSFARPRRRASRSRSCVPPTPSRPSGRVGSASSRSRVARGRRLRARPPASTAWLCRRRQSRSATCVAESWSSTCPTTRPTARGVPAGTARCRGWPGRSAWPRSATGSAEPTTCPMPSTSRTPTSPLTRRRASCARAASGPVRRSRGRLPSPSRDAASTPAYLRVERRASLSPSASRAAPACRHVPPTP